MMGKLANCASEMGWLTLFVSREKPYKSELSVVLMPTPMQLIETEKYKNLHKSAESVNQMEPLFVPVPPMCPSPAANEQANPFYFSCPIKTVSFKFYHLVADNTITQVTIM